MGIPVLARSRLPDAGCFNSNVKVSLLYDAQSPCLSHFKWLQMATNSSRVGNWTVSELEVTEGLLSMETLQWFKECLLLLTRGFPSIAAGDCRTAVPALRVPHTENGQL